MRLVLAVLFLSLFERSHSSPIQDILTNNWKTLLLYKTTTISGIPLCINHFDFLYFLALLKSLFVSYMLISCISCYWKILMHHLSWFSIYLTSHILTTPISYVNGKIFYIKYVDFTYFICYWKILMHHLSWFSIYFTSNILTTPISYVNGKISYIKYVDFTYFIRYWKILTCHFI